MKIFGTRTSPPGGEGSPTAKPFLEAFMSPQNEVIVKLEPRMLQSPAHAGIMLVDIMRHMARAMTQAGMAASEDEANAAMYELIVAEYENPTDFGTGSIVN